MLQMNDLGGNHRNTYDDDDRPLPDEAIDAMAATDGGDFWPEHIAPEPPAKSRKPAAKTVSTEEAQHELRKPTIIIDTDQKRVNDEGIEALSKNQERLNLYQQRGQLVRVIGDSSTPSKSSSDIAPKIVRASEHTISEMLADSANYVRGAGEELKPSHPARWTIKAIQDRGHYEGIRELVARTKSPILLPCGEILQTPGYHNSSGILYVPSEEFPSIDEHPTRSQAVAAACELLSVASDFPFESPVDQSCFLAGLLTVAARFYITGNIPIQSYRGNRPGTGKGLLLNVLSIICMGDIVSPTSMPRDDEEMRKLLLSIAIAGDEILPFDNVAGDIGSPALEMIATSRTVKGRILGKSESVNLPFQAIIFITGNNISARNDTGRRLLELRMHSPLERPEERSDFQHGNLIEWVKQNRTRLYANVLTILRAYLAAGSPRHGLPSWGSFESYSAIVREAIVWIGQPDPYEMRHRIHEDGDRDSQSIAAFISALRRVDPQGLGLTAAEIIERMERSPDDLTALVDFAPPRRGGLPTSHGLGMKLNYKAGRNVSGYELIGDRTSGNVTLWKARECGQGSQSYTREVGELAGTRFR